MRRAACTVAAGAQLVARPARCQHRPVPPRVTSAAPIEAWVEFASPYSYLSAMRLEALAAEHDIAVLWRPFLLGPIFEQLHGVADSPFNRNPARRTWMWQDVQTTATSRGLPFRPPSQFPRGSLLATRVALLAEGEPWLGAFIRGVFTASFVDDADIGSSEVVGRLLSSHVSNTASWIERAAQESCKRALRTRTEEARRRGVFGAPTFFVDGIMQWGDDRLERALRPDLG